MLEPNAVPVIAQVAIALPLGRARISPRLSAPKVGKIFIYQH